MAAPPLPKSDRSPLWGHAGRVGAFIVGGVLLLGAYAKLIDPEAFAEHITKEGLDFLLPAGAIAFVALALELGLGFALILNLRRTGVLVATSMLVLFFLYLTGKNYWAYTHGDSSLHQGCGCFGNLVDRNPAEAFWQDLVLLVPTTVMAWFGRPRAEDEIPMWALVTTAALTLAGLVFTWMAPTLPLDDLATRLKPGVKLSEVCMGEGEEKTCFSEAAPQLIDEPDIPDEIYIVVIADPYEQHLHEPLNDYANKVMDGLDGMLPPLLVLTSLSGEEIEDLLASELAPSFDLMPVPRVLLRPMYRSLPRSFLWRDGEVIETVSGLPPFDRWGKPADE